jgi:hypothetical protein
MALVTTNLTNGGLTTHYQIKYDSSLSQADGVNRANALIAVVENDFTLMTNWFGGIALPYSIPYEVDINLGPAWSASWGSGPPISLIPGNGSPLDIVRFILAAEVTEMFMLQQGFGWSPLSSSEGTAGEGLSHFLSTQLLMSIGSALRPSNIAGLWLNSPRLDFVNNVDFVDHSNDPKTGCAVLFLWYLFTQLGFSVTDIVAAGNSELSGVYRNLTGDSGDPFPFFKRLLDTAFPSTTTSVVPGPNADNPFPLGLLSFWVDKSTFGRDEVLDAINTSGGTFPNAFWLVVEGFNITAFNALGVTVPDPTGTLRSMPGVSIARNATTPVEFEDPGNPNRPQRIRIAFDVTFSNASLAAFPNPGDPPATKELHSSISVGGNTLTGSNASATFELVAGADPYFTNVDPAANNVFWLSQDLRVFTATPGMNHTPVPGGPTFTADSVGGAFAYVQQLLAHLNANYSDPTGTDPFNPANHVIPSQAGAFTGDSSVTPFTFDFSNFLNPRVWANYNFAIARVRLRGTAGPAGAAPDVKVFFRLWSTQTADTDYQVASTYPFDPDANSLPGSPRVGADHHTIPFFATGNLVGNTDYAAGGVNNRPIQINSGDSVWAYYGCFLNLFDSSNTIDGQPVQHWLNGTHHCIVAQIAYDEAPIINANGLTMSPESCDKLAQRNLQFTNSDNPGSPDTHRIPQTFDIRPSPAMLQLPGTLLDYPDELMIDWGNTPIGSTASIYWPQVNGAEVIELASRLYGSHLLSTSDPNTLTCKVTKGATYVPIPPGTGENFAGLLTVDLPPTVVKGQVFKVVVRRVATRRSRSKYEPKQSRKAAGQKPAASVVRRTVFAKPTAAVANEVVRNWRYVVGTFQVTIPVVTKDTMLLPEENTLAILKWRLQTMSPTSRWHPVLERYISYLSARVDGLGGNADQIKPSPHGVRPGQTGLGPCAEGEGTRDHGLSATGKISGLVYDHFGDFEGFLLDTGERTERFNSREKEVEVIARRAWAERIVVSVFVTQDRQNVPRAVVLRAPPPPFVH